MLKAYTSSVSRTACLRPPTCLGGLPTRRGVHVTSPLLHESSRIATGAARLPQLPGRLVRPCTGRPRPLVTPRLWPTGPADLAAAAAAAAAAAGGWDEQQQQQQQPEAEQQQQQQRIGFFAGIALTVRQQLSKLDGLWGKFIPMAALFFLMAFVNTIADSLKDSLVITAAGGGTHVIPYLTVYGVLPSSLLFLIAYSWGTQRASRERLFNIILGGFVCFYATFGLLYPAHEALHLSGPADALLQVLPSGLSGMVGMVRNWLFTLFYCVSELWGDVMLSLLFWGLANETTSIEDAPLLYPLFGIGANVAQTVAGQVLRILSQTAGGCKDAYAARVQFIMALCVTLGVLIMGLHRYISRAFPTNPKGSTAARVAAERAATKAAAAAAAGEAPRGGGGGGGGVAGLTAGLQRGLRALSLRHGGAIGDSAGGVRFHGEGGKSGVAVLTNGASPIVPPASVDAASPAAAAAATARGAGAGLEQQHEAGAAAVVAAAEEEEVPVPPKRSTHRRKKKKAMSLRDAFDFLKSSPQIRCLAIMALAQGITCNLLDLTFKHHLHKLHASPAAYSAFLGNTAMWTGIVTGSLMFTSPLMFDKLGWKGVASATPNFMMYAGLPFFAGCVVYNLMAGTLAAGAGATTLKALVVCGAVLQVVARGAKFSLFKPAEEMVYIGLDDESRTKGKAAIDVVGAQSGKSTGSMLQQALLILSGGTLGGILPVLMILYTVMLTQWKNAVGELGDHYDPAHAHRMSMMGSMSESDSEPEDGSGNGSGGAGAAARRAAGSAAAPAGAAAPAAAAAPAVNGGEEQAGGGAAGAAPAVVVAAAAALNGHHHHHGASGSNGAAANGHSSIANGNGAHAHLNGVEGPANGRADGGMGAPKLPASAY